MMPKKKPLITGTNNEEITEVKSNDEDHNKDNKVIQTSGKDKAKISQIVVELKVETERGDQRDGGDMARRRRKPNN